MKTFLCLVTALSLIASSASQLPFDMMAGMNNMATMLQGMGMNLARQGQTMYANGLGNAQWLPQTNRGLREFVTPGGGRGFAFNSPDGSMSSFSFSSGGPSSGFMFHQGPNGRWERRW